ncbi:hypothetical protein F5Y04DRAFT_23146 [Hypomontagnella monticulosa]|nr:hypothetical protein F5Y04DRAFT_23146 [Hypomontagnella monticulosa]
MASILASYTIIGFLFTLIYSGVTIMRVETVRFERYPAKALYCYPSFAFYLFQHTELMHVFALSPSACAPININDISRGYRPYNSEGVLYHSLCSYFREKAWMACNMTMRYHGLNRGLKYCPPVLICSAE